jgi:dTDP-L-rhamnose 4-epimerase
MEKVLVTGGAGFIGSHIVDLLVEEGHKVYVLDALEEQVHRGRKTAPEYLNPEAEFVRGDVRDKKLVDKLVSKVDAVIHEAALVGVGQSMYQIDRYVLNNDGSTGALLQAVVEHRERIRKIIVASSMSIYGEGRYVCPKCGPIAPRTRREEQLVAHRWELECEKCRSVAKPMPTDETKPLICESIYAITKKTTEELCLVTGAAYKIPTVALRYFNVYGPRQALSNPYTGLLAIVASRVLNGKAPIIFEDGEQSRDFVSVKDVARANLLALKWKGKGQEVFNIGTGRPLTVNQVVAAVSRGLNGKQSPVVTGKFRAGDIRHCYAEVKKAEKLLGFKAAVRFEEGLPEFLDWAREEEGVLDLAERCLGELESKGLVK